MSPIRYTLLPIALLAAGQAQANAPPAPPPPPAPSSIDTWVSRGGTDSLLYLCSQANPCASINFALSQTSAGGEVNILDSGEYSPFTVSQAVTIRAVGTQAHIRAVPPNFPVNIIAGVGDTVVLEGLDIEGQNANPALSASVGVYVYSAGAVLIKNCAVRGFTSGGIDFNSNSTLRLTVQDSEVSFNNNYGIYVGNRAGGVTAHAKIFNTLVFNNASIGIYVYGTGNDVVLSGNRVLGSIIGLSIAGGATGKSYGDNIITSGDVPTLVGKE